jgi:hypothetical protein
MSAAQMTRDGSARVTNQAAAQCQKVSFQEKEREVKGLLLLCLFPPFIWRPFFYFVAASNPRQAKLDLAFGNLLIHPPHSRNFINSRIKG